MDQPKDLNENATPADAHARIDPQFKPPRPTYNVPLQGAGLFATAALVVILVVIGLLIVVYIKQSDDVPVPDNIPATAGQMKSPLEGASGVSPSAPASVRLD